LDIKVAFIGLRLYVVLSIFFISFISFLIKIKHLLTVLIVLEFIILGIYLRLVFLNLSFEETFSSLRFLAIAVCESALGLTALVLYTRRKGRELLLG